MLFTPEKQYYKQYEVKEGIVFLIELSESIFRPLKEISNRSQLQEILLCVNTLISEMVVTFPKNGVGIYLYNGEDTGLKFPKNSGLNKIFSLNDLNSSNMKTLASIVKDDADGFRPVAVRYPVRRESLDNLHTVFLTVLREFQSKPHYNRRKLLWFTANDKPYVNPNSKDSLRTIVSDFEEKRIHIKPIFLHKYSEDAQEELVPFDMSLYETIFINTNVLSRSTGPWLRARDSKSGALLDVANNIRESIRRLKEVRRMQFSCDLVLSDGPGIGGALGCSIKGYTLFDHEKIRPLKQLYTEDDALKVVYLDSVLVRGDTKAELEPKSETENGADKNCDAENSVVKGIPVRFTNDISKQTETNERVILLPPKVMLYLKGYSFDHVPLFYDTEDGQRGVKEKTEHTIEEVPFSKAPYLKLLCFRRLEHFQPFFNMKPAFFVFADLDDGLGAGIREGGFTNSRATFTTLFQSCVKLQRYAVVFGCTRPNSSPNLYALYPTNVLDKLDKEGMELPNGFLLVNLPWLGEIRSLPDYILNEREEHFFKDRSSVVPAELVDAYKGLIDSVGTITYNPHDYSNPVLQYFYKTLKQEVLLMDIKHEDKTVEGNDWSVQELLSIRKQFTENMILQLAVLVVNSVLNTIGDLADRKRGSGDTKRAKPEPVDEADVITLWRNGTWQKFTVPQLRESINRYQEIPLATKKADMIANISRFFESRRIS